MSRAMPSINALSHGVLKGFCPQRPTQEAKQPGPPIS